MTIILITKESHFIQRTSSYGSLKYFDESEYSKCLISDLLFFAIINNENYEILRCEEESKFNLIS